MQKDAPKCPKGLPGQCLCASLSPASKEHNLVIALCVCVCVSTLQLKSPPLAQRNPNTRSNMQNRR